VSILFWHKNISFLSILDMYRINGLLRAFFGIFLCKVDLLKIFDIINIEMVFHRVFRAAVSSL
jgi:hypothetical protein